MIRLSAPIAVDAMGGDRAPAEVVSGAVLAARELQTPLVLVGAAGPVGAALAEHPGASDLPITVADASESVQMDEPPLAALRRKPRASIRVACELVRDGAACAVVSAGHTGATFLAAHTTLGLLPGVQRAALAVIVPTRDASAILIDAGANVECRPEHLVQFGVMGAAYARAALGVSRPSVGLLSIGEEAGKGTDLVRQAYEALTRAPVHFVGNVEARDAFTGRADVIVCDGFTGNVVLKVGEGLAEVFEHWLRHELEASVQGRVGGWLSRDAFRSLKRRVDAAERGAAPVLGVNGLVLAGHGRSSARAVRNAIATAARLAEEGMLERVREGLENKP